MKKVVFICVLSLLVLFSANAQGFYFDIGVGVGTGRSLESGYGFGISIDGGFKMGYRPHDTLPLYFVGSICFYFPYSYIFGIGLVYYPIPMLQLAGSMGVSISPGRERGLAYDISLALDTGGRKNGFLMGTKFFNALHGRDFYFAIGVFARYAYR